MLSILAPEISVNEVHKSMELGFLKFEAQQFSKVWGGEKLHKFYAKPAGTRIGESWEISGVSGKISSISQRDIKEKSLHDLIQSFGPDLLGQRVYETYKGEFPLLFKFIDAKEDLSVQLHPDDTIAKQYHDSLEKRKCSMSYRQTPRRDWLLVSNLKSRFWTINKLSKGET